MPKKLNVGNDRSQGTGDVCLVVATAAKKTPGAAAQRIAKPIQAVSSEISARNPRLTSAATPGDTPRGVIEFPILPGALLAGRAFALWFEFG
jgi:hypothetical protein